MADLCYFFLMLGFFSCTFFSVFLLYSIWKEKEFEWAEAIQITVFFCVSICFIVLLYAFYKRDFSYVIVTGYTDTYLPWYYALSAIWAGQEGSLMLWLLFIASIGFFMTKNEVFKTLNWKTRSFFWAMFLAIEGFFFLLLTTVSNPFLIYSSPPSQGNGLNPLLMHPGMIFHPPALFLGYGLFLPPALLLLSQRVFEPVENTFSLVRKWSILAWIFLSVGIVLGMWWSYYELGWGGYWAWDPVENSSLIPWLCFTAFLHVYIVMKREKALERYSGFLIGLGLISCFFATFLTRSGIIESLHAFGEGAIGKPILFLIITLLILVIYISIFFPTHYKNELSGMFSKNGMLLMSSWIFMGLALIILIGTMYPIISEAFLGTTKGVSQDFYNRVFLPIAGFLIFLIMICPWIKWKTESIKKEGIIFILIFISLNIIMWFLHIKNILAMLCISVGITGIFSVGYFVLKTKIYSSPKEFGKWGIHLGIFIIAISIAVSSAYKKSAEFIIAKGQKINFEEYSLDYKDFLKQKYKDKMVTKYVFDVYHKGEKIGTLVPEKILFFIQNNIFSKVSVISKFFDEIYISVLQATENGILKIELQNNPMVHWIWIGSIIATFMAFLAMGRER